MDDLTQAIAKWAPLVLVLLAILWTGARGYWFWGSNARAVIKDLERQRQEWRALALALLRQRGIVVPADAAEAPPLPPPDPRPPVVDTS